MQKILVIFALILIAGCAQPKTDQTQQGGEKMVDLSGKTILMVIAPTNFKDEEYYIPKEVFEKQGATVKTASITSEATSSSGKAQAVDLLLNDATTNYDAIVFIGGSGASTYFNNKKAHELAKSFFAKGKIVAAICIAPSTLANAGILKGKKATVFPSEADNLKKKGATYTGEAVTQDVNIITANGPKAAKEFAKKISENL